MRLHWLALAACILLGGCVPYYYGYGYPYRPYYSGYYSYGYPAYSYGYAPYYR